MRGIPTLLILLCATTGCVPASMILAQRDVSRVEMGAPVDGGSRALIDDTQQVLSLSKALDPLMAKAGFDLTDRSWSYGLYPNTATTYTGDYYLRGGAHEGWARCLAIIDTRSVRVKFCVSESSHGKGDYPPEEDVRALIAKIMPDIKSVLTRELPGRAIQVSEIYWPKSTPQPTAAASPTVNRKSMDSTRSRKE